MATNLHYRERLGVYIPEQCGDCPIANSLSTDAAGFILKNTIADSGPEEQVTEKFRSLMDGSCPGLKSVQLSCDEVMVCGNSQRDLLAEAKAEWDTGIVA